MLQETIISRLTFPLSPFDVPRSSARLTEIKEDAPHNYFLYRHGGFLLCCLSLETCISWAPLSSLSTDVVRRRTLTSALLGAGGAVIDGQRQLRGIEGISDTYVLRTSSRLNRCLLRWWFDARSTLEDKLARV